MTSLVLALLVLGYTVGFLAGVLYQKHRATPRNVTAGELAAAARSLAYEVRMERRGRMGADLLCALDDVDELAGFLPIPDEVIQ